MQRLEKIRDRSNGRVDIFPPDDLRRNMWLSSYLSGRGYIFNESPNGSVSIAARNPNTPNNSRPVVYLDGVMLTDFSVLWRFRLDIVDYIEINQSGVGSGIMGGGGVIRIVTDPTLRRESLASRSFQSYKVPLAFGSKKQFYTPVYSSYNSEFFKTYGTLGWVPDLTADTEGGFSFFTKSHELDQLVLHVEGIVNGDEFVSCRIPLDTDIE